MDSVAEEPTASPAETPADAAQPAERPTPRVPPLVRRRIWGPDALFAVLAIVGLSFAAFVWYQPPLLQTESPAVSCTYMGKPVEGVKLYTPLSMPARYYVLLPNELRKRYRWFSIDLRREICAISDPPAHTFFGKPAIRRSDPLGLDLEFRHLDGSEWHILFEDRRICLSNAILRVTLTR